MQETWVRSLSKKIPWRRKWLSTPVFLPGEFHGLRSLVDYSPWGRKESDMAERLHLLTRWTFVGKVMPLLFNMLSSLVITFLPRTKSLLISWLQSPSSGIWELPKIKSVTVSIVFPSICHDMMWPDAMILVFWMLNFKPTFHSPLSLSSRGSLVLFHFLP